MRIFSRFWKSLSFLGTLIGLLYLAADTQGYQDAITGWQRIFAYVDQERALFFFAVIAMIYIFWIDLRAPLKRIIGLDASYRKNTKYLNFENYFVPAQIPSLELQNPRSKDIKWLHANMLSPHTGKVRISLEIKSYESYISGESGWGRPYKVEIFKNDIAKGESFRFPIIGYWTGWIDGPSSAIESLRYIKTIDEVLSFKPNDRQLITLRLVFGSKEYLAETFIYDSRGYFCEPSVGGQHMEEKMLSAKILGAELLVNKSANNTNKFGAPIIPFDQK